MVALSVEEKQAFEICKKYDMLSPLYETGIGRDGCFFCPNAGKREREMLKQNYPELVKEIYEMIDKTSCQTVLRLQYRNNWVKDYLENNGDFNKKEERQEKELNGQMTIEGWFDENN